MTPEYISDTSAKSKSRRSDGPSLLVATLEIQDPQFRRSIVLIAEHTSAGAIGFVINRPSPASLSQLVGDTLPGDPDIVVPPQIPTWYGGPVESASGVILHNQARLPEDTRVAEGISLSSVEGSLSTLVKEETRRLQALNEMRSRSQAAVAAGMLPGFDALYPYRFLAGYAGWGAGQLDDEILAGGWLELPLDLGLLFNTPWHNMWDRAISGLGIVPPDIARPQGNTWLN